MTTNPRGWIFYDGNCPICRGAIERFHRILHARGFGVAPLETPWVQKCFGLSPNSPLEEMKVLTHRREVLGGTDALIYLTGQVWWAWPLWAVSHLSFARAFAWKVYRWVARNRYCLAGACTLHPATEKSKISLVIALTQPRQQLRAIVSDRVTHLPIGTWIGLVAIAVIGSCLYGASLSLLFPRWHLVQGALWIALSAGFSWCLFIPLFSVLIAQRPLTILHASLVTMAHGEAILFVAALFNVAAYERIFSASAFNFNIGAIALSNVVMVAIMIYQLTVLKVSATKLFFAWMIFLNGSGLFFFWMFRRLLFAGVS